MKKATVRNILFLIIIATLISLSAIYKSGISKKERAAIESMPEVQKGKKVVSVWMIEANDSETRRYQVNKYNRENRDGIYIDFRTYDQDYYNMLRLSLASDKKPDIFQYGYYELIKNDEIIPLDEAGVDTSSAGEDNLLYFNKKPYGVKLTGNNVKFIWNREILKGAGLNPDEAPKTWDDVLYYARQIKKAYPDVVPFQFPANSFTDMKASIGEASVNKGTIYTSFWDYKKGVYDFSYARDILNLYNKMYAEGLIDPDFNNIKRNEIRMNFYSGKSAMVISTFEDKNYFANIANPSFSMGVAELPKFNMDDTDNYYYLDNYNCLVINKNVQDMDAVRKVYQWFYSSDVGLGLLSANKSLPMNIKNSIPSGPLGVYNNSDNFMNEVYDPSTYIISSSGDGIRLFSEAIKGTKKVDEAIDSLNKVYNDRRQFMADKDKFDYDNYYTEK